MLKSRTIIRRAAFTLIAFAMLLCMFTIQSAAATYSEQAKSVATTTVETGNASSGNYFKITTSGKNINVVYTHKKAIDGISPRLLSYGGSIVSNSATYLKDISGLKAGGTASFSYDCSSIPSGTYNFRICDYSASEEAKGNLAYPTAFSGVKVVINSGVPTLHEFKTMSDADKKYTASIGTAAYKDTALTDYKFYIFKKAGSSESRKISAAAEAKYYKSISDKIVSGKTTDYAKAMAIFEYVAGNFYYDYNAKSNNRTAYDDPYNNLQYFVNKTGNNYNAFSGKVAVHCDGYASLYTALARAQGIPSRMVYGRKIANSSDTWEKVGATKFNTSSHTWVQSYIDGRWVYIDPQQGSNNEYGDRNVASNKTWKHSDLINYYYFDISPQALTYTHHMIEILPGSTSMKYLGVENEKTQLKTFLSSNGNGKKVNSSFSATNTATWSKNDNIYTNGFGSVQFIDWSKLGLKGKMNLKDFKNLKNLLVYKNNLKSLNITGCTELATVSAVVNDITTFDASTSKKLKKADVKANPLTTVKVYAKSKVRTIKASGNGHFGFEYDNSKKKSITIIAVPDPGYKLKGIYTGSGKKISTKLTTSFAPTVTSYTVKFALDPNSFKYVLRKGNNSSLAPYNLSVQKRLKELGYYKGKLNGKFDSATDTAVKKFQKKNGLKANGFVKEDTWKKLFSTKAKKK